MTFFSGFSLQNEEHFFSDYIKESQYSVCGFSYGSLKALNHVKNMLENSKRVDTLQLLSPIFFQTKSEKFKKLQLMAFKKDNRAYIKQFSAACFAPYSPRELEFSENTLEDLEELLTYVWADDDFKALQRAGVKVEVYLGSEDKIIDVKNAREYFTKYSTLTYIKNANHFLLVE